MNTEANITIEDSSNPNQIIKIVHISGQLDESNIDEKIQEIYKLVEANPKNLNLVYDLENLEYMNSKSIGYITDLYSKITENGGQVTISKAKANILDILQVVGLTQLIKYFDSIEEAKKSLGSGLSVENASAPQPPATATTTTPINDAGITVTPSTTAQAATAPATPAPSTPAPATPAPTSATQVTPATSVPHTTSGNSGTASTQTTQAAPTTSATTPTTPQP